MEPCPNCASPLAQPVRWTGGAVRLRCPECESCFESVGAPAAIEAAQNHARRTLRSAYTAAVGESMAALADCWHEALARDLIGADDFADVR